MSSNPQDEAEALDSDKLGGEYPPEKPLGVDEYGTTPAEERVDEPLEERVERDNPDTLQPQPDDVSLEADPDAGDDQELIASEVTPDPRAVEFDEDDPSERLGDASTPAEEQAIHRTR